MVDDKAKYADWSKRDDIKAELKVDLIILLAENDYPPVDRDEVYKEIFEQAENLKSLIKTATANKKPCKINTLQGFLWSRRESNSRPNKQSKSFLHV